MECGDPVFLMDCFVALAPRNDDKVYLNYSVLATVKSELRSFANSIHRHLFQDLLAG